MTEPEKTPDDPGKKLPTEDILVFLSRNPEIVDELSADLAALIAAVHETEKAGTLTYTIKATWDSDAPAGGMVKFTDSKKFNPPEIRPRLGAYWLADDGALLDAPPAPKGQHVLFGNTDDATRGER